MNYTISIKEVISALIISLLLSSSAFAQSKSFLKAQHYYSIGLFEKAIDYYEKALENKRNDFYYAEISFKIGECYRIINDTVIAKYYEDCIIYLKKQYVHYRTPFQKSYTRKLLGISYYYTGEYTKANKWLKMYIDLYPNDISAVKYYINALNNSGRHSEADTFIEDYISTLNTELSN